MFDTKALEPGLGENWDTWVDPFIRGFAWDCSVDAIVSLGQSRRPSGWTARRGDGRDGQPSHSNRDHVDYAWILCLGFDRHGQQKNHGVLR